MRISLYKTIQDTENENRPMLVKERGFQTKGSIKKLNGPQLVADLMQELFQLDRATEEHVYILCLNTANHPLALFHLTKGTINTSLINPREILLSSLLVGASAFILVHNHPSGETKASESDISVTCKIKNAAELIGINMLDHIIIGKNCYTSLKEEGVL